MPPTARKVAPPIAERVGQVPPRPVGEQSRAAAIGETLKSVPPPRKGKYVDAVEQAYMMLGMAAMPFAPGFTSTMVEEIKLNDNDDDETPLMRAHHLAVAWDNYALTNPSLRRWLDKLAGTTPVAVLVTLHTPLVMSAASELGLFSQVGKLFSRWTKKSNPTPPAAEGIPADYFGRTHA